MQKNDCIEKGAGIYKFVVKMRALDIPKIRSRGASGPGINRKRIYLWRAPGLN